MEYAVGFALAPVICWFARGVGFDRDRAFYPTVLLVTASYYVLFAAIGSSLRAIALESVAMSAFGVMAVAGFKRNLWIVAAGLAAHGVFDLLHDSLVSNPGVPQWWPGFCLAIDAGLVACLAWLWTGAQRQARRAATASARA